MVPEDHEYLSFLMGASAISDEELRGLGVEILEGVGSDIRGLCIPESSLDSYVELIRRKLPPGFWNDIVGRTTVFFIFKMGDGAVKELVYSPGNRAEISRLCSRINGDPIEKTSDVLRYMATNGFYRDAMVECHGVTLG